jgi:hypothetical protein
MVFGRDQYGDLWRLGTVYDFVNIRNRELKVPTYKIYRLTEVTEDDIIAEAEQAAESRYGGDGHFADNH